MKVHQTWTIFCIAVNSPSREVYLIYLYFMISCKWKHSIFDRNSRLSNICWQELSHAWFAVSDDYDLIINGNLPLSIFCLFIKNFRIKHPFADLEASVPTQPETLKPHDEAVRSNCTGHVYSTGGAASWRREINLGYAQVHNRCTSRSCCKAWDGFCVSFRRNLSFPTTEAFYSQTGSLQRGLLLPQGSPLPSDSQRIRC